VVHELEPKLIITIMHDQQHIKTVPPRFIALKIAHVGAIVSCVGNVETKFVCYLNAWEEQWIQITVTWVYVRVDKCDILTKCFRYV